MISDTSKILVNLPQGLRDPLLKAYQEIAANYIEHRWEPSELNGGKFCEVVFTIIDGTLKGAYAAKPSKPKDMVASCRAIEQISEDPHRVGDRSLRILIPRILQPLYEIRNNRGVGHVGGDVDPNFLDATAVYGMVSWTLAELVRIFHNVTTQEAQDSVDALIERQHPLIWEVGDVKRVLDASMKTPDQVLLLLHQKPTWVTDKDLADWVEYSSESMFRTRVLRSLHKKRLIEHDRNNLRSRISPIGVSEVETRILKSRIQG